jgi:hypothetical protein
MANKLSLEAFEYYAGLGPARSYQAVADHFGVAKGTVFQRAKKEDWPERIRALEKDARQKSEKRAHDALEAVRERQLKQARFLQGQALSAMKELSPKDAVKMAAALAIGWKHELLLLGEPTDRSANVEEIVKREYENWMVTEGGEAEAPDEDQEAG